MYLLAHDGACIEYPYSVSRLQNQNPQVSFPSEMSDEVLSEWGVHRVHAAERPTYDVNTERVAEGAPVLLDGTWRQAWEVIGLTPEELASKAVQLREEAKSDRQAAVDAIKVTVSSGKVFDGDETSQTRMARAIVALQATGVQSTMWGLADNTFVEVTLGELVEALALAGTEQTRLWSI